MTSEGGGKFKQKRNRNTKPYERPKSILNRVGDVVRSVLTPSSWVPSLVSWSRGDVEEVEVEETSTKTTTNPSHSSLLQRDPSLLQTTKVVATSRCSLNSLPGPSGVVTTTTTSSSRGTTTNNNNNENHNNNKKTLKHRIPLGKGLGGGGGGGDSNSNSSFWNLVSVSEEDEEDEERRHERISSSSSSRLDDHGGYTADNNIIVAGPSTSTPFVSPNPVPFARESSSSSLSRRNVVERTNGRASLQPPPPTRNVYAKLKDIGKLSNDDHVSNDEHQRNNNNTERQEIENSANLAGNDSHSECSEESVSTSGCSSMVPHPDKREYQKDVLDINKSGLHHRLTPDHQMGTNNKRNNDSINWEGTRSVFDRSVGLSNSFLWSDRSQSQISKPQPPPPSNRPQFNSFLFGSPVFAEKTQSKDNDSLLSTPYSNKASYGFGSTYRRARLNATNPYSISSSAQRHIRVKTAKNADIDVMSTTAKRILETLEKMSTPITDAKRIPSLKQDQVQDTPLTFTASAYRRRPNLSMKNNSPNISRIEAANKTTSVGPPVSKLMTSGSVAVTRTYLRNVDLEPSKVINAVTTKPTESNSSPVQREEVQTKAGGKMKVQHRSGLHYSKSNGNNDIVDRPDLPSIPLPIQNLPKFNFFGNSSTSAPSTTSVTPKEADSDPGARSTKPSSNTSNEPTCDDSSKFKFSSPIVKQAIDSALDNLRKQNVTNFTFSSPISVKDAVTNGQEERETTPKVVDKEHVPTIVITSAPTITFKAPTTTAKPVLKMKPIPEKKEEENKEEEPSKPIGGIGVASELKTGSVMDILGKKSSVEKPSDKDLKSGSVKSSNSATTFSSLVDKFKMVPGSWECPVCMVNNNESAQKCVACDKKKPIPKGNNVPTIAITPPPSSTFDGFGNQFRSQTEGTWECPTCMLRVKDNLLKCMSCETAKPTATVSVSASKVSWAAESKPTGMWECDICMVRNSADVSKCIACESNKPGTVAVSAPGSFKFGFSAGSNSTSGSTSFKFGISSKPATTTTSTTTVVSSSLFSTAAAAAAPATTTSTFKFGLPSTVQTTLKTTTATTSSPAPFSFGLAKSNSELSVTSSNASVMSSPAATLAFGNSSSAKLDLPTAAATSDSSTAVLNEVSDAPAISSEKQQQNTWKPPQFTFGVNKTVSADVSAATTDASAIATSSALAVVSTNQTAPSQTFSFGSAKSATESGAGGFSFGSSLKTTSLQSSTTAATTSSSTPLSSGGGGFSFKFGSSEAKKDSQPSVLPASAVLQPPPVFSFGGTAAAAAASASDSKTNAAPTSVIPVSAPSSNNAPGSQALSSSGGFQFQFGASATRKREADSDSDISAKKMGVTASTSSSSSFGVFGSNVAPPAGSFSFGSSVPNAAASSAVAAPTGPIFGALSTVAEKAPSSNTFTFGANTNNNNSSTAAVACTPLFGAPTSKQAQLQFGAPKPQTGSTFTFGATPTTVAPVLAPTPALSTSTSSFAPFSFGMQGAGAGSTDGVRASAPLPSFGSTAAAAPAFGAASLQQSSGNVFGSQQPAAPSFGSFGNTALPGAASVQGFGATPVAPNGGGGGSFAFSAAPTFQFGASAPPPADSGVFTFTGSQANAAPAPPSNSGFSFNQPMAPSNTGFNFNPSNQLNFSFGSGGQEQPTTFTATQNPFDAHGSKRPIKKAKRRTQK